jgi:hypothetical protein
MSLDFIRPLYGAGFDSAFNRNEYQEYFLGGESSRCIGLTTYQLHVLTLMKYGSLNLMELPEPVIGLYRDSFTFTFTIFCVSAF